MFADYRHNMCHVKKNIYRCFGLEKPGYYTIRLLHSFIHCIYLCTYAYQITVGRNISHYAKVQLPPPKFHNTKSSQRKKREIITRKKQPKRHRKSKRKGCWAH
jgi:hypothetical protein